MIVFITLFDGDVAPVVVVYSREMFMRRKRSRRMIYRRCIGGC